MKRNLKNQSGKEDGFWVLGSGQFIYRGYYDNGQRVGIWECIDKTQELLFRSSPYDKNGRVSGLWQTYKADTYNSFFTYTNHHNKFSSGPSKRKFEMITQVIHIF